MFTLYAVAILVSLSIIIYLLCLFGGFIKSRYNYEILDMFSLAAIVITVIVSIIILCFCGYAVEVDSHQDMKAFFDPDQNMVVLCYCNIAVWVIVFIRNTIKTSILYSPLITFVQLIISALLVTLVIIAMIVLYSIYARLMGNDKEKSR